jgi:MoaA/NifB/PqqE/SkfB family radical SAM enzyme
MIEQTHFKHLDDNSTYLTQEDYPKVDELLDYLTEKNRQGYIMVNSKAHLQDMKEFMRGKVKPWNCRAGQNSMLIRTDGTIAPCFPLYSANYDWGTIENHKFDFKQLGDEEELQFTLPVDYAIRARSAITITRRSSLDRQAKSFTG